MRLAEKVPRYSLTALRHTCSMLEFGGFSSMHAGQATYSNHDFVPDCSSGLYCATFVKADEGSENMAKVLDKTFKRILRTQWTPVGVGERSTRFCVYRIKEKDED